MMHTLQLLIIRPEFTMSQPAIDLTSELLRGMRLSGVNYRRIETHARLASALAPWRVKPSSISSAAGRCMLRMASGEQFTLRAAMRCFIPNGDGHALLSIRRPRW